jgi:hypothetical protein
MKYLIVILFSIAFITNASAEQKPSKQQAQIVKPQPLHNWRGNLAKLSLKASAKKQERQYNGWYGKNLQNLKIY